MFVESRLANAGAGTQCGPTVFARIMVVSVCWLIIPHKKPTVSGTVLWKRSPGVNLVFEDHWRFTVNEAWFLAFVFCLGEGWILHLCSMFPHSLSKTPRRSACSYHRSCKCTGKLYAKRIGRAPLLIACWDSVLCLSVQCLSETQRSLWKL